MDSDATAPLGTPIPLRVELGLDKLACPAILREARLCRHRGRAFSWELLRSSGLDCLAVKKAPTEADALLSNRIGAYGVLSPVVGDSVLGWFMVTSTPFCSD